MSGSTLDFSNNLGIEPIELAFFTHFLNLLLIFGLWSPRILHIGAKQPALKRVELVYFRQETRA